MVRRIACAADACVWRAARLKKAAEDRPPAGAVDPSPLVGFPLRLSLTAASVLTTATSPYVRIFRTGWLIDSYGWGVIQFTGRTPTLLTTAASATAA